MNQRAENAFLALPVAIDAFDTDITPMLLLTELYHWVHINNTPHTLYPKDLDDLLDWYLCHDYLTSEQVEGLQQQLKSPDRENWLLAFIIIDAQKHKLWSTLTH
jgi:hypothetical protein